MRVIHKLVLEAMQAANGKPLTAYEILDALNVGRTAGKYTPPQAYRALRYLIAEHLVHRLESLNAYVPCQQPDHSHGPECSHNQSAMFFICERCKTTLENEVPCLNHHFGAYFDKIGFQKTSQFVEILGICKTCAEAPDQA